MVTGELYLEEKSVNVFGSKDMRGSKKSKKLTENFLFDLGIDSGGMLELSSRVQVEHMKIATADCAC